MLTFDLLSIYAGVVANREKPLVIAINSRVITKFDGFSSYSLEDLLELERDMSI